MSFLGKVNGLLENSLIFGVGGFAVGYVYGALAETSRMAPAKILAVHGVAYSVLRFLNCELRYNGAISQKMYYFCEAALNAVIGTLAINALRKSKLIDSLGTIVFGACVVIRTLHFLKRADGSPGYW